jgi:hypothetical protein
MVFKLVEAAQKSWRRLDGHNQLPKPILDVSGRHQKTMRRNSTSAPGHKAPMQH